MYKRQNTAPLIASPASGGLCAVRLGKLMLHSGTLDEIFSPFNSELKQIVTVHAEMFVYAHENAAFGAILQNTVNTIDGRIVHYLCSLLYPGHRLRKLSGSDFIYNLVDYAMRHRQRIFLLGAEAISNQGTLEVLRKRYPDLAIDGHSPAFCASIDDQKWNEGILSRIAEFCPTHLAVCFGPVKQEMWIAQHADRLFRLGVRCAYGLGGTLDFVSGRKRRAPKWVQSLGAEWVFRAISEPRRLGRTAKMFKMPYFALKFYNREIRMPTNIGAATGTSDLEPA